MYITFSKIQGFLHLIVLNFFELFSYNCNLLLKGFCHRKKTFDMLFPSKFCLWKSFTIYKNSFSIGSYSTSNTLFWHTSLPHQTAIFDCSRRNKWKSWPYKVETVVLIYVNYAVQLANQTKINGRAGAMAVHTGLKYL